MPRRGWALLALPLLLAGCTADTWEAPTAVEATSPASSPVASPSADVPVSPPPPSPDPAPVVVTADDIPTDCRDLVDASVYDSFFGDATLNHPDFGGELPLGDVEPFVWNEPTDIYDAVDQGAEVRCVWGEPTETGPYLSVEIAVVEPGVGQGYIDQYTDVDWRCSDTAGGSRCTTPQQDAGASFTYFARDNVMFKVVQEDFPTNNLIGAIAQRLWGRA
jgi:hypothetical protein